MKNLLQAGLEQKYGAFPVALLIPFLVEFLGGFLSKCGADDPAQAAWEHLESDSLFARAVIRLGTKEFYKAYPDENRMSYGQTIGFVQDFCVQCKVVGKEAVLTEVKDRIEAILVVEKQITALI